MREKRKSSSRFGLIVRNRIQQLGYKEYEFADKIGLGRSSLSRYLSGASVPDYITARKICWALDLDINEIDSMDLNELLEDTKRVIDLRREFERLGIIEKGQDLSQTQLDLLRGLILTNKAIFKAVDNLISADDLIANSSLLGISNNVDDK